MVGLKLAKWLLQFEKKNFYCVIYYNFRYTLVPYWVTQHSDKKIDDFQSMFSDILETVEGMDILYIVVTINR